MLSRLEKLREAMTAAALDAALLTSGISIRYFTGFTSEDAVVLVTERDCILFTDFRYTIQARLQTPEALLCEITEKSLKPSVQDVLERVHCKRCGFEQRHMTVSDFSDYSRMPVAFQPFSEALADLRMIKTADEIACLQKAQQIADAAYQKLLGVVQSGMTERQVAAELNHIAGMLGSEGPAFPAIVASGPNGAMCHAEPGERRLQKGDLVVVDFGCIYAGYRSDMTRTFGVIDVDDTAREIYGIVLEAQKRALEALKAGISGRALDAIARDYISEKGYGACFGHSLGHGFGLEIHEAPRASKASEDVLEAGMTITVEPGIYLEGRYGVRIEDCCVVTESGKINLVSSPKELRMIS